MSSTVELKDVLTAISIVISVVSLFIANRLARRSDRLRAEREARLDRVNRQLKYLYGPLFALNRAANEAWSSFRSTCRPEGGFWEENPPPSNEEMACWRLWITEVFMPLNLRMENAIIENADLLDAEGMPQCLQDVINHVACYKTVLKRWEGRDYSVHTASIDFPRETLSAFAETNYRRLVQEQRDLLGMHRKQPGSEVLVAQ